MGADCAKPPEFWDTLAEQVSAKVEPVLQQHARMRQPVIVYLRDLEVLARQECDRREVIQIIASGRRILGDREQVGRPDGPFSRT
ncbi:hypothetical protein [Methylobacterium sp. E-066]|uniref:hypothetical protein n=1 Tax=Methylobacterium sp. E-066 TaxID=2836584 RepID=UPI001FBAC52E|nr:hypothetical protein [Methylobacterium sp. E-066]MCJ2141116.1 hypothetical protein [Methylobacterium sp. E-066]